MVAKPPITGKKCEHQNWDTNVIHYNIISDCYLKAETKNITVFVVVPRKLILLRHTYVNTLSEEAC